MVSAKGLVYGSPGTKDLLATCEEDSPLVVQLFGNEPEFFAQAMDILLKQGFRFFDLNCGCSVKKVTKTGSGSSLMTTPDILLAIVKIMVQKAGNGRVGVKIRLGREKHSWQELAPAIEQAGAGWICMHPRTGKQEFRGQADWNCLKELKQLVHIPVLGSGDLFTAQNALDCIQQTGVDTILFARGALNDPSIFAKFQDLQQGKPQKKHNLQDIKKLTCCMEDFYIRYGSPMKALLRMRTLLPRFIKDINGAKEARTMIQKCTSWKDVYLIFDKLITKYEKI